MGLPISTKHLRDVIQDILEENGVQVFYKKAKNVEGIHIVFRIDDFKSDEVMKVFTLDVRVVDKRQRSDMAELLADAIWDGFDHLYYLDDSLEFTTYQNTRSIVDEEDASVIHRRLLFEVRAL